MRKKYILLTAIIIMIFWPIFGEAQISVGARGGISIPNLTAPGNNPVSNGYSSKLGLDAAVFVEIPISKRFSIQPMLEYSQQGGKKSGIQAFPVPDKFSAIPEIQGNKFMYVDLKSKAKLNYLLMPILAKFGWDFGENTDQDHFRFYVAAGPFIGYLLSAHQVLSDTQTQIFKTKDATDNVLPDDNTIDIAQFTTTNRNVYEDIHNFNTGISGNIGIAYHFEHNTVFFEVGGNYGFLNIQKDTKNGKNHTGAATAAVGYAYSF